jgi:phosphoglucosamine mutase
MEVMAATGKELRELRTVIAELPQVLENVMVASKDGWDTNSRIAESIRSGERTLGPRGRILVRPSGTEPLIRVMVEAPSEGEAHDIAESISDVIHQEQG